MGNDAAQELKERELAAQKLAAIRELKWREVMSRVDAYRFYIKLLLEAIAFFFAATGAILGFYLNQPNHHLKLFLLLPILMGTVLGSICIYATQLQKEGAIFIEDIRQDLKDRDLITEEVPDVHLLDLLLRIFGIVFFLIAALLAFVPLLKGTFCTELECVDSFVVIAGLILGGGGFLTYCDTLGRVVKNLKNKEEETRESRKREKIEQEKIEREKALVSPATSEGKALQEKGAPDEAQPAAGINESKDKAASRRNRDVEPD